MTIHRALPGHAMPAHAGISKANRLSKSQTRDLDIVNFIRSHTAAKGYPPTIREIGDAAGISSTSVVNYHLAALEAAGKLRREHSISRGIRLVSDATAHAEQVQALVEAARRWRAGGRNAETALAQAVDALEGGK